MKKMQHARYNVFDSDSKKPNKSAVKEEKKTNDNEAEPALITTKEAARLLRVSESWLKNRRWKKQEPLPIKMGGKVFYRRQTVLDMMKS